MHSTEIDPSTVKELYYQSLADIYITAYEDQINPSKRILTAMGVIVSMHSDLLSYRSKNSSNEKVKKQEERLMLLETIISEFSTIADRNYQLRILMQQKDRRIEELEIQLQESEKENKKFKQLIEAE